MTKVVIVESPTKAKSIKKYLGRGYDVIASTGHLRDLPKSTFGVDVENNFEPKYINIKGKDKTIKEIKSHVAKADQVYLATDPDREGEAISWHLAKLLGLDPTAKNRVTFNEITKKAVVEGIKNVREIDIDLVNAYQARRVLDRIVGYKLSPLLWKKIRKGLSAGRVQSVVTRLVVDRENEIRAFVPEEYWTVELKTASAALPEREFPARLIGYEDGTKFVPKNAEESRTVEEAVRGAVPVLASLHKKVRQQNPAPPFITSSLQQEASRKLMFSAKKTMKIAQNLYEGMNVPELGLTGLITYMRTDSQRLSEDIVAEARNYISENYGSDYLPAAPRVYKTKASAQDAHEAIRPTHVELTPESLRDSLDSDHYRLYKLIWDRFIACQMTSALYDTVAADIHCGGWLFRANGKTLKFPGYSILYVESSDAESENDTTLPPMSDGEKLLNRGVNTAQKFTQPPARYNEASLIRAMEEKNIGRPSTYAPTVSTILDREYVEHEGRALKPTPLGEIVNTLMVERFTDIINVDFTAHMEESLDAVEHGQADWHAVVGDMYKGFAEELAQAEKELDGVKLKVPETVSDQTCDICGRNLVVKSGRFGKFLACPGYPECKFTKPISKETPGFCPRCGGKMLELRSKKNNKFFACENRNDCGYMTWDVPLAELCPKCGGTLFRRYTKEEKCIRCAREGCDYSREYKPRGRSKPTEEGTPSEDA
ncbi:MAG: type I DNA topoisomerase [Clostridiales bacterium]|nr:type I DNA topoisomerase [Clostridiales bacterium]